jgi:ketosteroid isomerase-like protein
MRRHVLLCFTALAVSSLLSVCASPTVADFKPDAAFAAKFADDWVAAWNAKDLHKILGHYSQDVEFTSPFIVLRGIDPNGRVTGKQALSDYWSAALTNNPDLHFELQEVLVAVDSIAILYRTNAGGDRTAVEVFHFNAQAEVNRSYAHYTEPKQAP